MKSFEQIAAAMYAAYRQSLQCVCPKTGAIWGQPTPAWTDLEKDRKDAWTAAAKQAVAEISAVF